jgi:AraC-like DNA-binding protein
MNTQGMAVDSARSSSPPNCIATAWPANDVPEDTDALLTSWHRCAHHKVARNSEHRPRMITQTELARAREAVEPLLQAVRCDFERLGTVVRDAHHVAMLATPAGVIVEQRSSDGDAELFNDCGTVPGAIWLEEFEGTNAIGTCAIEQRPINVRREQHFRKRYDRMNCSGVPIFGPDAQFLAVLTVSSYDMGGSDGSHSLALAVTRDFARAFEERQFRAHHHREWNIVLARFGSNEPPSMLAVDRDHRVVGANKYARQALALGDDQLLRGIDLWTLFETQASTLTIKDDRDLYTRLISRRDAGVWQALITPPDNCANARRNSLDALRRTIPRAPLLGSLFEVAPVETEFGGLPPRILRHVQEHISSHLDEELDLRTLAHIAGRSRSHFARSFKQSTGHTPHEYILRRRVEHAEMLLVKTSMRLSEIALAAGFSDQSHFSRHFRRATGKRPSTVRWEHQSGT